MLVLKHGNMLLVHRCKCDFCDCEFNFTSKELKNADVSYSKEEEKRIVKIGVLCPECDYLNRITESFVVQ